jgi:hypothetical protein
MKQQPDWKKVLTTLGFTWSLFVVLACYCEPVKAQILIDKPVKAGELTLVPDLNNENFYYYVSDKPRLATDANNRPQFSFLRFVENVRSAADQPETGEGQGGGIVHALVSLSVTREQLDEARRELRRLKPEAQIQGPVVYKSGRFGLVSAFKDENGNLTTKVVGLGVAPVLDGEKAAVSILLTKGGAKILWESFKTPTPDISFTFEMDLTGYRSPHRAVIEANFDQIYEHTAFGAGLASTYLSAEIKTAFDDLQRTGAIKLTQVGTDEKIEALITTAYNKIADMMFSPAGGTGTPSLESLTGGANGNLLDRAGTMLARNRAEAEQRNESIRREEREAEETRRREAAASSPSPTRTPTPSASPASASSGSGRTEGSTDTPHIPLSARGSVSPPAETQPPRDATGNLTGSSGSSPTRRTEASVPSFALVAAFEFKKVRQRGTFRVDLNKYTSDSLTIRFDENIGDLRRLFGDAGHFREVNLDDPLFKQREIVAFIDGLNASDFGQYINFVTVRMRKQHAGGDVTDDEKRFDRNNFNAAGNNVKLLYGWKNDNDRRRWMEYDYQTVWSFFGGRTVEQPWQHATSGAINLGPPYQRRTVEIQADPAAITAAEVRAITVKIFYNLGGTEQVKQVTLNATKGQLSEKIEFMLPANTFNYDYEITWRLRGDRTVSSGRRSGSDSIMFVDELPRT